MVCLYFNINYLSLLGSMLYFLLNIPLFLFLGEFLDFQFKIYFQVNSSLDRYIYRIFSGMILQTIFIQFILNLPESFGITMRQAYFFILTMEMIFFLIMEYKRYNATKSIAYSLQKNLIDLKFLDSFEKTILFLSVMFFLLSFPELRVIPKNIEQLHQILDSKSTIADSVFKSVQILYNMPFGNFSQFYWIYFAHFYIIEYGLFLFICYSFFRYFFSRRSALIGIFSILTTWRITKIMAIDFGDFFQSLFPIIWIWSLFWSIFGKTYRSGLFLGLLSYWGISKNMNHLYLIIPSLLYIYKVEFKDKTSWFIRQHFKYFIIVFCVLSLINFQGFKSIELSLDFKENLNSLIKTCKKFFLDKGFYSITIFAPFVLLDSRINYLVRQKRLLFSFSLLTAYYLGVQRFDFLEAYVCFMLTFLCLIPLEWFFLIHSKSRSYRNAIYLIYILVCLLDSHFEGRLKSTIKIMIANKGKIFNDKW